MCARGRGPHLVLTTTLQVKASWCHLTHEEIRFKASSPPSELVICVCLSWRAEAGPSPTLKKLHGVQKDESPMETKEKYSRVTDEKLWGWGAITV